MNAEIVTLKEHFAILLHELEKRVEQKFTEHEKALVLARDNSKGNTALLISVCSLLLSAVLHFFK